MSTERARGFRDGLNNDASELIAGSDRHQSRAPIFVVLSGHILFSFAAYSRHGRRHHRLSIYFCGIPLPPVRSTRRPIGRRRPASTGADNRKFRCCHRRHRRRRHGPRTTGYSRCGSSPPSASRTVQPDSVGREHRAVPEAAHRGSPPLPPKVTIGTLRYRVPLYSGWSPHRYLRVPISSWTFVEGTCGGGVGARTSLLLHRRRAHARTRNGHCRSSDNCRWKRVRGGVLIMRTLRTAELWPFARR